MKKQKRKYYELCKVKGRMRELGLSYRKLSEKVCLSPSVLCNKINGYALFNILEIKKVANELHIQPEEIPKFFFSA